MKQYRPCGNITKVSALANHPASIDFENAMNAAEAAGITRLDQPRRTFVLY
jgi:putative pyruvate formate lyase activating enzyme